jgi:transcriptional regulator GlxA family with amidase domain
MCQGFAMDRGRQRSISIGLVVVHESAAAVLYSLHEVFSFVGQSWEEMTGRPAGQVRLVPRLVAERRGLTTSRLGVPVSPDAAFADAGMFDVVIAPDLALEPGVDPRGQWPAAAAWLREQYAQGAIVCSVCTGSVLLAEAGLLDGLEATSHWGAVPLFERFYPRVRLESARVLVPAGAEHRIITSGGYSSWAELALYLVARFCGQEEAIRTAKVFVLGDRSEGQLPFAAMVRPRPYDDAAVARSQQWIAEHYATANPVARMIEVSALAPRTFKRRFAAATGYSPIAYVQALRIEEAKHLLETTAAPTDDVGAQVGYADPASFRRIFRRSTGVTPARYRQRFQSVAGPKVSA